MRKVSVKYNYLGNKAKPVLGYLVNSNLDLVLMQLAGDDDVQSVINVSVSSGESPERLDHVVGSMQGHAKGLAALAISKAALKDLNPLHLLGDALNTRIETASKLLNLYGSFFLNGNGGMTTLNGLTIVEDFGEVTKILPEDLKGLTLKKGSKVINLENDPKLELTAVNQMLNRWGKYSSVVNLRANMERLEGYLLEFKAAGGTEVYVYTTGLDVEQMYEYAAMAMSAGLSSFYFEFKGDPSPEVKGFLTRLKTKAKVTVIK